MIERKKPYEKPEMRAIEIKDKLCLQQVSRVDSEPEFHGYNEEQDWG